MARKGNPISVRLDLNRRSDSSRFSEGRPRKSPKGSVFSFTPDSKKVKRGGRCRCPGRTRLKRRPGPEHVVKEAHFDRVSGAKLNVDIMNTRHRIPESRATTPLCANR